MLECSDINLIGRYKKPLEELRQQELSQKKLYASLAFGLLAIAVILFLILNKYADFSIAFIVFMIVIAPAIWLMLLSVFYQIVTKPTLKRRLDFKIGELLHWQGSQVLEIIGIDEDENCRAFVLDDGSGKMLFVCGKYLCELIAKNKFPCQNVELLWGPQRKFFIGLFTDGSVLEYTTIHYGELDTDGVWLPTNGDIIEGSIDSFVIDFKKHIDGY